MDTPERLTAEERRRIGAKLRGLRVERNWNQIDVAARAGVSHGTLKMIERGTGREVRPANLEKIAAVFELTIEQLRLPHGGGRRDPLLTELNHEDIAVARHFHTAIVDVKVAIRNLLIADRSEQHRALLARAVLTLLQIRPSLISSLGEMITAAIEERDSATAQPRARRQMNGK